MWNLNGFDSWIDSWNESCQNDHPELMELYAELRAELMEEFHVHSQRQVTMAVHGASYFNKVR